VQLGTRFVCSTEAKVHQNYKDKLLNAKDRDALVTGRSTGHPVRVIKNQFTREFIELEKSGASIEDLEKMGSGRLRIAVVDGDVDKGSVMSGQIAGMINDIKPCNEIIQQLVQEAHQVLGRLNSLEGGEIHE
jgi:enoyl-[acyl-carrier protein] reductase II